MASYGVSLFVVVALVAGAASEVGADNTRQDRCSAILSGLDGSSDTNGFGGSYADLGDSAVLEIMSCLLKFEGDRRQSKHTSAGRSVALSSPTMYPGPTVEVAALFECSALFYRTGSHAMVMVLINQRELPATHDEIRRAYRAYRCWFKKVKALGLAKARGLKLNPLDGTGLKWIGQSGKVYGGSESRLRPLGSEVRQP